MAKHRINTFSNPETRLKLVTDPQSGTTKAVRFITDLAFTDLLPQVIEKNRGVLEALAPID